MDSRIKVSVIIPIYNVEQYVERCLLSVLRQTYDNLEVILVNDATKDGSMLVVKNVLQREHTQKQVKIVAHAQNKGLSAARNTGFLNSTGDYVLFCDSDDWIVPECVQLLVEAALSGWADMVIGDYEVKGSSDPFPELKMGTLKKGARSLSMKAFLTEKVYPMAWNKLVKRDFIQANRLFFKDGLIHEDRLWNFQCACHISHLAVVKEKTYVYNVRENSIMTGVALEDDFKAYLVVLECMIKYALEQKLVKNRYVYSFLEEEKFFLNYAYVNRFKLSKVLIGRYLDIVGNRSCSLWRVFLWGILHKSYRIRDAHYFLPAYLRGQYYLNLPQIKWRSSERCLMKRFNKWYIQVVLSRFLRQRKELSLFYEQV